MRRRYSWIAVLVLAALAAAGCGSSSPSPQPAAVPVTSSTSSVGTATPPAPTPPAPTTTTTTATSQATTQARTTPAVPTSTATTTEPAAPPSAPAALSAATGYGSYDDCQGTCTGAVPASLRRPLHLPSVGAGGACPVSSPAPAEGYAGPAVGPGPVYAAEASPLAIASFIASSWDGARVTWVAAPTYTGPVLIRGSEASGSGSVGFGEGHVPDDELQLLTPATTSAGEPSGAREWPSFTRVPGPGCYAYQVDGTSFSEVIVFQASG